MSAPDWFTVIAVERGLSVAWLWVRSEVVDGHFLVTGAVCPMFTRGPRKGLRNWAQRDKATERTLVITPAELRACQLRWEVASGRCHACAGTGQENMGWTKEQGTILKTCRRCTGSGTPAATEDE
jgi:hypothetical protein